jgi:hypothetical protein
MSNGESGWLVSLWLSLSMTFFYINQGLLMLYKNVNEKKIKREKIIDLTIF